MKFRNQKGNHIVIEKIKEFQPKEIPDNVKGEDIINITLVDLETTGLKPQKDKILEIAMLTIQANKKTGTIYKIIKEYEGMEDPKIPIPKEITKINGLTNEMVKDKVIDWKLVYETLYESDYIMAHNAPFDRGFLERVLPNDLVHKIWMCSKNLVQWKRNEDLLYDKQEMIALQLGFFYDAHRAMDDIKALLKILTEITTQGDSNYLKVMLDNIHKEQFRMEVRNTKYRDRETLKECGLLWNGILWWMVGESEEVNKVAEFLKPFNFTVDIQNIEPYQMFPPMK